MRRRARRPDIRSALAACAALAMLVCGDASAQTPAADLPEVREPAETESPLALPPEPESIRFRVAIEAPRRISKMLEEGLDLVRWQRDERVTLPVLERLIAGARKATLDALAAEGYFSPDVRSEIEMRGPREGVVHLIVKPGAITTVRGVDIGFQGSVLDDREGAKRI